MQAGAAWDGCTRCGCLSCSSLKQRGVHRARPLKGVVLPTGWLNVLGQFATTAGVGALLANHIANMWLLGNGHVFTSVELLLTYASARRPSSPFHSTLCHCCALQWCRETAALLLQPR